MELNCEYCRKNGNCNQNDCMFMQIVDEAEGMQSFLEITTSEDPTELIPRLSDMNVTLARSGKLLADAIELQDNAIAMVYEKRSDYIQRVSPTIATKYINSQAAHLNKLVKWLDRINRSCVHQSENLRTQISFAKQDLALTRKGY